MYVCMYFLNSYKLYKRWDLNHHYTFAHIKESRRMINFFNSTVDRLERIISNLTEENIIIKRKLAECKESLQFHSDLVEKTLIDTDKNMNLP